MFSCKQADQFACPVRRSIQYMVRYDKQSRKDSVVTRLNYPHAQGPASTTRYSTGDNLYVQLQMTRHRPLRQQEEHKKRENPLAGEHYIRCRGNQSHRPTVTLPPLC